MSATAHRDVSLLCNNTSAIRGTTDSDKPSARRVYKWRFLDYSAAVMLCSADTKVRGRFSETRWGPSRRRARNASGALENFACYPQKTFSTASVKLRVRVSGAKRKSNKSSRSFEGPEGDIRENERGRQLRRSYKNPCLRSGHERGVL